MKSILSLNELAFDVSIGVYDHEKVNKQRLFVNIEIELMSLPKGCQSDDVVDVICYDHLIAHLRKKAQLKHFELIEHFAWILFNAIAEYLQETVVLTVAVLKDPKIPGLKNATFSLSGKSECKPSY